MSNHDTEPLASVKRIFLCMTSRSRPWVGLPFNLCFHSRFECRHFRFECRFDLGRTCLRRGGRHGPCADARQQEATAPVEPRSRGLDPRRR